MFKLDQAHDNPTKSALSDAFSIQFTTGKPPLPPTRQANAPPMEDWTDNNTGVATEAPPSTVYAPSLYQGKDNKVRIRGAPSVKSERPMAASVAAALATVKRKNAEAVTQFNPLGLSKGTGDVLKKDKVNSDILARIRAAFHQADRDRTGKLEQQEFIKAFVGILQTEDGSDEVAVGKLFMRIDANSDGAVDWDEFSNYMLLESQGAASIRDLETSVSFGRPDDCGVREELGHRNIITHIEHITMPNGADRYVTCGKDGVVKIWNAKNMQHLRAINTGNSWVTCARMLPTTKKLAVSSFSRSMKIYDLLTYELCGQIPEIDYAPMSMDCWTPPRRPGVEMVVFGDGGGFVRLYELNINPLEEKGSNDRYLDTQRWKFQHHTDWVAAVRYVPEMNAVVAASLDKTLSITDAEDRVPLKMLHGHTKGVTSVAWSPVYKVIVSGGQDRKVLLWNPFSQKPLATLTGHLASVTAVIANDVDNQIISLSADKQIKLWDIRNHKCIQTTSDREVYTQDDDTLLCAVYDQERKTLVTGHTRLKLWHQTVSTAASAGHRHPVVRIIYNPQFEEAVSGDQGGTISVWSVPTGKLRFRFHGAHKNAQLTSLNFDSARRRLFTGADNGEVKVWNFSSGACLCRLKPVAREEVTCVVGVRSTMLRHLLVGGWSRKVTFYEDNSQAKEVGPGRHIAAHKSDILDMATQNVPDGGAAPMLATVSDDGEVCVWNVESGACRKRLLPPGQDQVAPNERPVEAVRFMNPPLQAVFLTVGADRFLRAWDAAPGNASNSLLMELFTSHKVGETVRALAVSPDNSRVVTAGSGGFIKVWDFSGFKGAVVRGWRAATELVHELALWCGHKAVITSVDWVDAGPLGGFVLSSSIDHTIALWSQTGAMVGLFGASMWLLDEPQSWKSTKPMPLEDRDQFEMDISRQRPRHRRVALATSPREGDSDSPDTATFLQSLSGNVQYQQGSAGGTSIKSRLGASDFGAGPRALGSAVSRSRASRAIDSAPSGAPSRTISMAGSMLSSTHRVGRPTVLSRTSQLGLPAAQQQLWRYDSGMTGMSMCDTNDAAPRHATFMDSAGASDGSDYDNSPQPADARKLQPTESTLSRSGSWRARPRSDTPEEVARLLQVEHEIRLRRVDSIRRQERPYEYEPGGKFSHLNSVRRRTPVSPGSGLQQRSNPGCEAAPTDGSDDGDGSSELASESEESSKHDSDDDVPRSLWLAEFELARRGKNGDGKSSAKEAAGSKNRVPSYRTSPGRKEGSVLRLLLSSDAKPVKGKLRI